MKLVIDIGNSRLKWATVDDGPWRPGRSVALEKDLDSLFDRCWHDLEPPKTALVANVSGQPIAESLRDWMRGRWRIEPGFFRSSGRYNGITSNYKNPAQLGCDRWAALIGARSIAVRGALCVVDCGTAVTVDALDHLDRFLGGVIFPGIDLIQNSLLTGTADIDDNRADFKQVFGTSTAEAVSAGSIIGVAGAIDRILSEMHTALEDPKLYITGGAAEVLRPMLNFPLQYEPDLVLIGLAHTLR